MTGTKFGCGQALCGACTVHLNGAPVRSCVTPISAAVGQKITTIEAIAADDKVGKAVHAAWVKHDVAQCGYRQSGQIMSATALLKGKKKPTDADIDAAMAGNVCRCGTYVRIRAAIHDAAKSFADRFNSSGTPSRRTPCISTLKPPAPPKNMPKQADATARADGSSARRYQYRSKCRRHRRRHAAPSSGRSRIRLCAGAYPLVATAQGRCRHSARRAQAFEQPSALCALTPMAPSPSPSTAWTLARACKPACP